MSAALAWSGGALAEVEPPSFSADIVSQDTDGARRGAIARLHAANHKTRIELAGATDGYFLSDADAGTALFVRTAQRFFLDAGQSTPLTQIFVRVDPRDPCRQWRTAASTAGAMNTGEWRCERVERAMINQREIIKYSVLAPDRRSSYAWVDPSIGFPVKWQTVDGRIFALENMELHVQPADLFSIPADYRKLDPHALLERIKHSDVWVGDSAQ